jgi:hypothetical protein
MGDYWEFREQGAREQGGRGEIIYIFRRRLYFSQQFFYKTHI